MHVVRKNGNCGAHGEIVSVQTARETLEQLQFEQSLCYQASSR